MFFVTDPNTLVAISAGQAVAVDSLLWSDLVASVSKPNERRFRFASDAREFLFGSEIAEIYAMPAEAGLARWQDMSASMRSVLKIFRIGLEVRQHGHMTSLVGHALLDDAPVRIGLQAYKVDVIRGAVESIAPISELVLHERRMCAHLCAPPDRVIRVLNR